MSLVKIFNVFNSAKYLERSHDGNGELLKVRPFSLNDFKTPIEFIDYVIISPNMTIGNHTHGNNEEIYFIVKGNGTMTTNSETFKVTAGDVIVNSFGDSHGLVNDSNNNIEVFIFQVNSH